MGCGRILCLGTPGSVCLRTYRAAFQAHHDVYIPSLVSLAKASELPVGHFMIKIRTKTNKHSYTLWEDYAPELLKHRRPPSILIFDPKSLKFLNVSDAAVEQYGYSREEFLVMSIKDILKKGSIVKFLGCIRRISKLPISTGVWKHHRKDGTAVDMEVLCIKFIFLGKVAILMLSNETSEPLLSNSAITRDVRDYLLGSDRSLEIVTRAERRTTILELDREMDQLDAMTDDALVWKAISAPARLAAR
jgi:hypothetical protein